jgi:hypothetical protein
MAEGRIARLSIEELEVGRLRIRERTDAVEQSGPDEH